MKVQDSSMAVIEKGRRAKEVSDRSPNGEEEQQGPMLGEEKLAEEERGI